MGDRVPHKLDRKADKGRGKYGVADGVFAERTTAI